MNDSYEEVRLRDLQPPSWKMKSLPKFTDVPEREFNSYPKIKTNDGEPSTPPPSPMGAFKYPGLLRGSDVWPRKTSVDAIVTELYKKTNHQMANSLTTIGECPDDRKQLKKVQRRTLQNFLVDIKPPSGKTKMYLWRQPKSKNFPKLDLSSIAKMDSAKSVQNSKSKVENIAEASKISILEKSKYLPEAENMKKEKQNNYLGMMSNNDIDVILKHALSHDPVITKHNSVPRTKRSMTFAERPKGVFSMKNAIFDHKKSSRTTTFN